MDGNIILDENDNPEYLENKLQYVNKKTSYPKPMINTNIKAIVEFPQSEPVTYTVKTDKNGLANFFIPIPISLNEDYTTQELLSDVVTLVFEGNEKYNESSIGANATHNIQTDDKNSTFIHEIDNFRRYKPSEVANILVRLL